LIHGPLLSVAGEQQVALLRLVRPWVMNPSIRARLTPLEDADIVRFKQALFAVDPVCDLQVLRLGLQKLDQLGNVHFPSSWSRSRYSLAAANASAPMRITRVESPSHATMRPRIRFSRSTSARSAS